MADKKSRTTPKAKSMDIVKKDPDPVDNELNKNLSDTILPVIKKLNNKYILGVLAVLIVIFGYGGFLILNSNPIPGNIRNSVKFTIYYPDKLPQTFSVNRSSFKYINGVLFYTIRAASDSIIVSEQKEPVPPPDLSAMTINKSDLSGSGGTFQVPNSNSFGGFISVSSSIGQAIQGTGNDLNPIIILSTDTTLINLDGSKNIPSNYLNETLNSLKTVN